MDPLGNSALIGEKVKSRLLTQEEIDSLSLGPYVKVNPEELEAGGGPKRAEEESGNSSGKKPAEEKTG